MVSLVPGNAPATPAGSTRSGLPPVGAAQRRIVASCLVTAGCASLRADVKLSWCRGTCPVLPPARRDRVSATHSLPGKCREVDVATGVSSVQCRRRSRRQRRQPLRHAQYLGRMPSSFRASTLHEFAILVRWRCALPAVSEPVAVGMRCGDVAGAIRAAVATRPQVFGACDQLQRAAFLQSVSTRECIEFGRGFGHRIAAIAAVALL